MFYRHEINDTDIHQCVWNMDKQSYILTSETLALKSSFSSSDEDDVLSQSELKPLSLSDNVCDNSWPSLFWCQS